MYQLFIQPGATSPSSVIRLFDGAFIPFDPENVDYQAYLVWLTDGDEPLPAVLP